MILEEYGNWIELVTTSDQSQWIPSTEDIQIDLDSTKLIHAYMNGEKVAKCWITVSSQETVVDRSFIVVEKEEELHDAIILALAHSKKYGGNTTVVGFLKKTN